MRILIIILLLGTVFPVARASEPTQSLNLWLSEYRTNQGDSGWERTRFLRSLLVPGLGQAEEGKWVRAALFFGVDVALISGHLIYRKRGEDLDADFRAYADEHWDIHRFGSLRAHENYWSLDEQLPDGVHDSDNDGYGAGSHHLPGYYDDGYGPDDAGGLTPDYYLDHFHADRTQQYYEMIGKYFQFGPGWDDFNSAYLSDYLYRYSSPNSQTYMAMRDDSNNAFRLADTYLMGVVLNHLASAVDMLISQRTSRLSVSSTHYQQNPMITLTWHRP